MGIGITKITSGIRSHSELLIADGLYSIAEGIALIGVLFALHYSEKEARQKNNTFEWTRLELLAGLLQEVLLLSISISIIVDAINKLTSPNRIQ
ncbi:unnamed protein product, partial [Didymodactylos carnosus]